MLRILLVATISLIAIAACDQKSKDINRQELAVTKENDSLKVHRVVLPNDSGIVYIEFENGEIKEKIRKDSMRTIIVEFNPGDSTLVQAWLSSKDSLANVRFSQIIMPDSTTDGPFGREIEYQLNQKGEYKLLIHENMMAGDPWAGVFLLKMKLSSK